MSDWIEIGTIDAIPRRGSRCVNTPSGKIAVFRTQEDQVFAIENGFVCVWIDCELSEGFELVMTPSGGFEAAMPEGETVLF